MIEFLTYVRYPFRFCPRQNKGRLPELVLQETGLQRLAVLPLRGNKGENEGDAAFGRLVRENQKRSHLSSEAAEPGGSWGGAS